jgi:predicted O-methyltransferase YrrM
MPKPAFPDGHFYSPVVDIDEVLRDQDLIWPPGDPAGPLVHLMKTAPTAPSVHGIDWNPQSHEDLLRNHFPMLIDGYDYPETAPVDASSARFHEDNGQFGRADARIAFCLLKKLRPRRIVEVGSGYSTLLMTDVNARFLDGATSITCVEPYPRPFMYDMHAAGKIELIQKRAQEIPGELFDSLADGDLLFIDSSHVSKTGSDVNRLFLDVLPRLAAGVHVHVHDIFFPTDYPKDWVIEHAFSWNEQYLLQALLLGSHQFEVTYGGSLARAFHREALVAFHGRMMHGSSFWMRKLPAQAHDGCSAE